MFLRWPFRDPIVLVGALVYGNVGRLADNADQADHTHHTLTKATRTIRLHPAAAERLEAWRPRQADERWTARQAWTELDLVATTGTGTPVDRNNLNRSIRRLCAETEIDPAVTPYELRHTAITHQCEAGHHAWQIADWAGTSEKMIYLHYRHLLDELSAIPPVDVADRR